MNEKNKLAKIEASHEDNKVKTFEVLSITGKDQIPELCKKIEYLEKDFITNTLQNVDFPFTVVVNKQYVDKVFRDAYYIYLSSKHFDYSRNCTRLCFFKGEYKPEDFICSSTDDDKHIELNENLIGITVVRPSTVPDFQRTVGRTLLDPRKLNIRNVKLCTTDFEVNILGKKYRINSFPFMSQDSEVMKCAETTVWGIMEFFGTCKPLYKTVLPSDIIKFLNKISKERNLPSNGLTYSQVTNLFKFFGFEPKTYNRKTYSVKNVETRLSAKPNDNGFSDDMRNSSSSTDSVLTDINFNDIISDNIDLKRIIHCYSLSAIPFAMGLRDKHDLEVESENDGHSVICIGCGEPIFDLTRAKNTIRTEHLTFVDSADFFESYVIMDDNKYPYSIEEYDKFSNSNMKVDTISVPLYKHVFLDAPSAIGIVYNFLIQYAKDIKDILSEHEEIKECVSSEPLITNLFLTSSSVFQSFRSDKAKAFQEKLLYLDHRFPRYIWVCELSPFSLYKSDKVVGEVILDATSDVNDLMESIISVRLGNYEAYHSSMNEDWSSEWSTDASWDYKFDSFQGNLENINGREASQ